MNNSRAKGITAVEMLIYVAILSLILGVFFTLMTSVFSTFSRVRGTRAAIVAAQTGFERVVREARSAKSITDVASILNAATSTLALSRADGGDIVFSVIAGALTVALGGDAPEPLTPAGVEVERFYVSRTDTLRSQAVSVEFVVRDRRGSEERYPFRTTVVLRGSYE